MISAELKDVLKNASDSAMTKYGSHYLTTAHVLLELMNNCDCLDILRKTGGNVEKLKCDVEQAITTLETEVPAKTSFIDRLMPPEWSRGLGADLVLSNGVKNALNQAHIRALVAGLSAKSDAKLYPRSSRFRDIEASDLLISILKESKPPLINILRNNNFAEIDLLFALAHGMSTTDAANGITQTEVCALAQNKSSRNEDYAVIVHNDDFTTMEFVVDVLTSEFQNSWKDAQQIMLTVHKMGVGVAGIFPLKTAAQKAIKAMELAQSNGFPFRCSIEPMADSSASP